MNRPSQSIQLCHEFQMSAVTPDLVERVVELYRDGRLASDSDVYPEYAKATFEDNAFYDAFRQKLLDPQASKVNAIGIHNGAGDVVGFAITGNMDDELRDYTPRPDTTIELHQIYVDPAHQHKGYGSRLFGQSIDTALLNGKTDLMINVLGSFQRQNVKAIGFYQSKGAKIVGHVEEQKLRMGQTFQLKCPVLHRSLV